MRHWFQRRVCLSVLSVLKRSHNYPSCRITSILISRFLLDLGAFRDDTYGSDVFSSHYHSSHLSFVAPVSESTTDEVAEDEDDHEEALERQGR